jgi:EpsD family peptidyl-prolyl cis-trans isomerase
MAIAYALVGAFALTGCSKKNAQQDAGTPAGQVIAHVGADEVTIQELENEFRLANVPPDKRSDAIVKRVLSEIIVRKYLARQALTAKLDREPTVLLDVLRSKEQILASASIQRNIASKVSAIGNAEIDKYIAAHPSQFAKRELLLTEQVTLPISENIQAVVNATKDFNTLDQVDQKLTEMGVLHSRATGVLDSANIPDELLAALQSKKSSDIFFVRTAANGTFFKITGEQSKPLTGNEAANRARQMIRIDLLKAESQQATQAAQASAKYEGQYAKIMTDQPEKEPAKETSPVNGQTEPAKN